MANVFHEGAQVICIIPKLNTFSEAVACLSSVVRKVPDIAKAQGEQVTTLLIKSVSPDVPLFGLGDELLQSEEGLLARWEKLVGQLREIRLLFVTCFDGEFHELGLAMGLSSDYRLATPAAKFTARFGGSGVVPLCSMSPLSMHVGLVLAQKALGYVSCMEFEEMKSSGFFAEIKGDLSTATTEFIKDLVIPKAQVLGLQRRLVHGCCIVERIELKGHAAACNALCVQHATSWDNVTVPRTILSVEDAIKITPGKILEINLAPHIRDVPSRELLGGFDHMLTAIKDAGSALPKLAAIYMPGIAPTEMAMENILVPSELIDSMSNGGLTHQEKQRAVIQWFLRWERVVDFIQALPMVTMAVLQGPGSPSTEALQLSIACDFRISAGEVVTSFPTRHTLPGVMTFQLSKHVSPMNANTMLMSSTSSSKLSDIGFTQNLKVDEVNALVGSMNTAALLDTRRLLDELWSLDFASLIKMCKKVRTKLGISGKAPVPAEGGSLVDIAYKSGVLAVTLLQPVITKALLKELKEETSNLAANALCFLGHSGGCDLEFPEDADEELMDMWDEFLLWIFQLNVPTYMLLHGKVNGNGLAIALACSTPCVLDGTELQVTEVQEGKIPSAMVLEAVRSVRMGKLQELLLLGKSLDTDGILAYNFASAKLASKEALVELAKADCIKETVKGFKSAGIIRQRLREMPQGDWPKNLTTIYADAAAAGYSSEKLDDSTLIFEVDGPVATLTINRANKANAYDGKMLARLSELIVKLEETARVVIIKSSDPRFFCAGADKERISNPSAADALHLESQAVFDKLAQAGFVSIAVIEGAACGGGLEWALACDVRVVGKGCKCFFPETALGLIPSAGGCTRLTALTGGARAKQIIMCGDVINAQRAVDWGVAQYYAESDPVGYAKELAGKMLKRPAIALELAKKVIDFGSGTSDGNLLLERISEGVLYQVKHRPMPSIVGTGTAVPEEFKYTQHEVADLLNIHDKRLRSLFTASHIVTRHLADIDKEQSGEAVTQKYLLDKHLRWAKILGERAIDQALARAGITRADIKFLTIATSTGFLIPTLSCHLVECMGLSPHIQRADIVGMGCHAGLNILQAASNWALANPGQNAVMCSIEICSAEYVWQHNVDPTQQMSIAVTNSLFGDGCTAAVVRCDEEPRMGRIPPPLPAGRINCNVLGYESYIIPKSLDTLYLEWDEITTKFSFFLTSDVPYAIGEHMPLMLNKLFDRFGMTKKDITHWVVHSGGKKVLDSMVYSVGITKHDVRHTVSTLRDYGNVSSGAFLLAFERLQKESTVKRGDYGVFVTMGPGAGMECALWRANADMLPPPTELQTV
ncbi:hypothetical protein CYMTET_40793 [Cymbomonas tetramitiformis]|uniref:Uncharacterized protein n=1 Tax=Cymbomonas tetramitiformis TaxID=36881 RepID=A0AAE0C7E0_9CHLO|nr:hypothetical protein CYMTET_40793 [Cymbomonas tetramitiformis]|eukprot:gene2902-3713_t